MRKKRSIQKRLRKEKFSHNQYWVLHYTECYKDKSERDFKVFLKARSAKLALEILDLKLLKNPYFVKRKSSHIYIVHKNYNRGVIGRDGIKFWNAVRTTAFPNEFNKLFKIEKKRIKGQVGRSNWSKPRNYKKSKEEIRQLVKEGRKYTKEKNQNWYIAVSKYGKSKANHLGRVNYNDSKNAKKELEAISKAMKEAGGNVSHASDLLGISHRTLSVRLGFFKDINWKKKYPNPPYRKAVRDPKKVAMGKIKALETRRRNGTLIPKNLSDPEVRKRMTATRKRNYKSKKRAELTELRPKLEKLLLKHNHLLKDVALEMGISRPALRTIMIQTGNLFLDFREKFIDNVHEIRRANMLQGRRKKRIEYLKTIKSDILEAYHQNDKILCRAAEHLGMPTSSYMRLFRNIKEYEV